MDTTSTSNQESLDQGKKKYLHDTKLRHLDEIQVSRHYIPAHGLTPNTSIQHKPLLIYRSAFDRSVTATELESHFTSVGVVAPHWRYTMYSTSHFHSTSHEVLGISRGRARLCFGHEDNPDRVVEVCQQGDVIIIPAGVAHRLLEDLDGGFEMVGCYPRDCSWDMCYGKPGEEESVKGIEGLGWFQKDPVYVKGPASEV